MKCPHCGIHFHDNWEEQYVVRNGQNINWRYRTAYCPGPGCKKLTIEFGQPSTSGTTAGNWVWRQVYPIGANRGPVPPEVRAEIAQDYIEACNVLLISPKASAALSRRCLENMLHEHGYKARDLAKEIDLLLGETDPAKVLPHKLRVTVDGIRHFGNFAAHPIDDKTSLRDDKSLREVIDVEPHEAEWCLEVIEDPFEFFYVGPEAAKAKKAALDAKLIAAGKPPSK